MVVDPLRRDGETSWDRAMNQAGAREVLFAERSAHCVSPQGLPGILPPFDMQALNSLSKTPSPPPCILGVVGQIPRTCARHVCPCPAVMMRILHYFAGADVWRDCATKRPLPASKSRQI
jgi:hypothetical protein